MFDFITYGSAKLQLLILLVVRASGLFITAPILGHRTVPVQAKIGLIILLAIITLPTIHQTNVPEAASLIGLVGMVLKEFMVGVLIGFFFALLMKAAEMAGALVGFQVGLIIAQAFDPNAGGQVPILGRLWLMLAMVIFLAIGGHHMMIQAFNDSYRVIEPGQMLISGDTAEIMIKFSAYTFVLALKIAAPVMITLVLTDVALGTVSKVMPTMSPVRSASTRIERLPFHQSRQSTPDSPGLSCAACSESRPWMSVPLAAASSATVPGTQLSTNQAKMSPTAV